MVEAYEVLEWPIMSWQAPKRGKYYAAAQLVMTIMVEKSEEEKALITGNVWPEREGYFFPAKENYNLSTVWINSKKINIKIT